MNLLAAAAAAAGVFLFSTARAVPAVADRIARYLRPLPPPPPAERAGATVLRLRRAGLDWTIQRYRAHLGSAALVGAFVGLLLAQGDLFIAGTSRSAPGLAAAGAAAGALFASIRVTSRIERRSALLAEELPVLADAVALQVLTGESVASALEQLAANMRGVGADELRRVMVTHHGGAGLPEALTAAARETAHPDASRLYELLATAHETGGRLADALAELSRDYRAGIARRLTAEGGRRALATYGPILALMIPVAVLFLMYPTVVGLRELSAGP